MPIVLPKPKSITADEVVLSRDDWERIVAELLDHRSAEDEDDLAAVEAADAEDAQLAASLESERGTPVETTIPLEVVKAEIEGAHPIRAWRGFRGWKQIDLAVRSGVGRSVIAQIETRQKKGSADTLDRLARAFGIPTEALIEDEER